MELYRQCLPRGVKDAHKTDLEKFECVSFVMTISPLLNIDREKMGAMGILLVIDDGVYVCICTVYSSIFKEVTQHAFVYDSKFSTKRRVHAVVQSLIINHMHPSVSWRKIIEKYNLH